MARGSRTGKRLVDLTGGGDDGSTALLGGGRAPKDDARIEAFGTIDETSSALGLARALVSDPRTRQVCEDLQRELYRLGAELATNPEQAGKFAKFGPADVDRLEQLASELEGEAPMPREFVLPGATPGSAALDLARTVARRAERRVIALARSEPDVSAEVRAWLNRLSLVLFVLARFEESRAGRQAPTAKGRPAARG